MPLPNAWTNGWWPSLPKLAGILITVFIAISNILDKEWVYVGLQLEDVAHHGGEGTVEGVSSRRSVVPTVRRQNEMGASNPLTFNQRGILGPGMMLPSFRV